MKDAPSALMMVLAISVSWALSYTMVTQSPIHIVAELR